MLANGFTTPVHPNHNGYAVTKSSRNAVEVLVFYEKLVTDKRYNWLTQYGIKVRILQWETAILRCWAIQRLRP